MLDYAGKRNMIDDHNIFQVNIDTRKTKVANQDPEQKDFSNQS